MTKVLVVEDSAATREYLVSLIGQDPALRVVGTAHDGVGAVGQVERLKPDVILMNVDLPLMNGYEATRLIMERLPTPIVMISSVNGSNEVALTFEALKVGALAVLPKPGGLDHGSHAETVRHLLDTLKLMSEVKVVRLRPERAPRPMATPAMARARRIRLVAMAASTGGPGVIRETLSQLPSNFGAPILVVQHIALGFVSGYVEWLSQGTRLAVKLGKLGEVARPGTVYIAPDGVQMGITTEGRIQLTTELGEDGFCPSASYLFHSVADACGSTAMGVLLTGMGRDGGTGLGRLRAAGGITIAQDEETSTVFGMPGEAVRLGAAEFVLPPNRIVEAIRLHVAAGSVKK